MLLDNFQHYVIGAATSDQRFRRPHPLKRRRDPFRVGRGIAIREIDKALSNKMRKRPLCQIDARTRRMPGQSIVVRHDVWPQYIRQNASQARSDNPEPHEISLPDLSQGRANESSVGVAERCNNHPFATCLEYRVKWDCKRPAVDGTPPRRRVESPLYPSRDILGS
jgi:hypothetical protein